MDEKKLYWCPQCKTDVSITSIMLYEGGMENYCCDECGCYLGVKKVKKNTNSDNVALQEYLDKAISNWRKRYSECETGSDEEHIASCYIDAFQSVRVSMLGSLLEEPKKPTIKKNECVGCGSELKLGEFSYDQTMCWRCFKEEVEYIRNRINAYPSWLWEKCDMHRAIIQNMLNCMAEVYFGRDWKSHV